MNFEDYESLPTTNVRTHMVAGAAAGVMEHCVMYPLDSVKVRQSYVQVDTIAKIMLIGVIDNVMKDWLCVWNLGDIYNPCH